MDQKVKLKLESFFSKYKEVKYKKGEIIIRPDDELSSIYLLRSGNIKQYSITEDGNEVTIHIFRPYSFFPTMLVVGESENTYYFEAIGSVELKRAPKADVIRLLKDEPEVLFDLTRRFALGINGLVKRLENLMYEDAYNRVISLLQYLSEKFGEKQDKHIVIKLPLTHRDIATWVNLTRETTSRQLEKLTKAGIISYYQKLITVKDPQKLEREL